MTTNLVTVGEKVKKSEITNLFNKHKIEKLIVIDKNGYCKGLITSRDIQKTASDHLACRDKMGRLIAAAAVGVSEQCLERAIALHGAEVDLIVIDSAHGHSKNVIKRVEKLKSIFGSSVDIIAGNVVTKEAVIDLCKAGADAVKVGIGPGSICTTRIVAGVGYPQLSAIINCVEAADKYGVPIIGDGGVKTSGDIAKAIVAGANCVMLGSLLAGTDEAPGETFIDQGRSYKTYRGMGSAAAMMRGSADRYFQDSSEQRDKLVAEGVEGAVPFKGSVKNVIHQLVGGLKSSMGYTGNKTIPEMQKNAKFVQITNSGLIESHPHSIRVTNE
jgi:IMP dehydrogenase